MNAIDLMTPNRLMDDERGGLPPFSRSSRMSCSAAIGSSPAM